MLTRRHIRIKVLQSLYAFYQKEETTLDNQEKFLKFSVEQMSDLYLLLIQLLLSIRDQAEDFLQRSQQKFLATEEEKNPSRIFVDNKLLKLIESTPAFTEAIEKKNLNYWESDFEYVNILFNELRNQSWYEEYLALEKSNFKNDQKFIVKLFKDIVAPNDKLYDYLEDKRLTWIDDLPVVNTTILRNLGRMSAKNASELLLPELYKNEDDREFVIQLFRKIILNEDRLNEDIKDRTPNWDQDRIAEIDMLILKMGIAEFLYFPSIPVKVTINEYLEIAKEYSTHKSSLFINGILDKVAKEFDESGRLNKVGRGLL